MQALPSFLTEDAPADFLLFDPLDLNMILLQLLYFSQRRFQRIVRMPKIYFNQEKLQHPNNFSRG